MREPVYVPCVFVSVLLSSVYLVIDCIYAYVSKGSSCIVFRCVSLCFVVLTRCFRGFVSGGGLGVTMLIMFGTYSLALWYGSQLVLYHVSHRNTLRVSNIAVNMWPCVMQAICDCVYCSLMVVMYMYLRYVSMCLCAFVLCLLCLFALCVCVFVMCECDLTPE